MAEKKSGKGKSNPETLLGKESTGKLQTGDEKELKEYKRDYVNSGVTALGAFFEKAQELSIEAVNARKNYAGERLGRELAKLENEYSAAYKNAVFAMERMWTEARERLSSGQMEHLHNRDCDDDFKLLTLPVTLTEKELMHLAEKHQSNPLFIRAIIEYAQQKKYDDKPFKAVNMHAGNDINENMKNLEYLQSRVENWYSSAETLSKFKPENASIFQMVENSGAFENL